MKYLEMIGLTPGPRWEATVSNGGADLEMHVAPCGCLFHEYYDSGMNIVEYRARFCDGKHPIHAAVAAVVKAYRQGQKDMEEDRD